MDGGDPESDKGAGSLEEDGKNPEQGGGKATGVRIFLQRRCTVGVAIWCRDVVGYSLYGTGPGGFPLLGGVATDGAAPAAEARREEGEHLGGGGKSGCGV